MNFATSTSNNVSYAFNTSTYFALHCPSIPAILFTTGNEVADYVQIPAHLLGNMWGQSWSNLYDDTKPFKNATSVDVTEKMRQLKYTPLKMFELSDAFYKSLGLEPNQMSYTGESIIEKPTDRIIQCHASAWNFYDGKDYRIKMCTNINQEDLITIHHEMGSLNTFIYMSTHNA